MISDDSAVVGYRELVSCKQKQKETIVNFRRTSSKPNTVSILGEEVEVVEE